MAEELSLVWVTSLCSDRDAWDSSFRTNCAESNSSRISFSTRLHMLAVTFSWGRASIMILPWSRTIFISSSAVFHSLAAMMFLNTFTLLVVISYELSMFLRRIKAFSSPWCFLQPAQSSCPPCNDVVDHFSYLRKRLTTIIHFTLHFNEKFTIFADNSKFH